MTAVFPTAFRFGEYAVADLYETRSSIFSSLPVLLGSVFFPALIAERARIAEFRRADLLTTAATLQVIEIGVAAVLLTTLLAHWTFQASHGIFLWLSY
jgi:hypothetical protein